MTITDYHAKYIAHELTRRLPSDSPERLAVAVAGAQKPWRYALIPHDAIAENMTLAALAAQFDR